MTISEELEARITKALEADERTRNYAIEAVADGNVITLEGTVPDEEARRAAGAIAEAQPGVAEVINDLEIGPKIEGTVRGAGELPDPHA